MGPVATAALTIDPPTDAMTPLAILAAASMLFWALLALDPARRWPRECRLPEPHGGTLGPQEGGDVVAVVPARDEAEVLPRTLPVLLDQLDGRLRVVLVDDDSTDGTAAVAREAARRAGAADRLTVVPATPTPPGWTGKVHALACGVEAVRRRFAPEWLLFTDADIRHRRGSVAALLAEAREEGRDLVSVMARLSAVTFWERLLIPPFVFFFQLLYPFRRVREPGSRVAAAAGGCVLLRRATLERAGGLASIRGAVIDDVSLARRVRDAGGSLWLGLDPGIVSVRPYRGLGELWRMVARSAFVQLGYRWSLLAVVLTGLVLLVMAPPFVAGVGVLAGDGIAAGLAGLAWGLEAWALLPAVRHHRVPGRWAWGLPFAALLYGLMTAHSAWNHLTGKGSRWKGRAYRPGG